MPINVVDCLEAIEINQENCTCRFGGSHGGLNPVLENPSVRQPGQRVVPGEHTRPLFCFLAVLDFLHEISRAEQQHTDRRQPAEEDHHRRFVQFPTLVALAEPDKGLECFETNGEQRENGQYRGQEQRLHPRDRCRDRMGEPARKPPGAREIRGKGRALLFLHQPWPDQA